MENQNIKFYEIKKTISEKDFLRTIIVGLGTSQETPADVFNGEFGNISCKNLQIVSIGGSAKVHCSASIGHDYQVEKKEYDHINKKYTTVYRTETKWEPYQTTYFAEKAVGFSENSEKSNDKNTKAFRYLLADICPEELIPMTELTKEAFESKGFSDIKNEAVQTALDDMKADAIRQSQKALPGDRYKDFSATVEVNAQYSVNYIVPYHDMTYKYSGEPYYMQAYANGECIVRGSIPKQEKQEKPNTLGKIFNIASLTLSLILLICAVSFLESHVFPGVIAALATVAFVLYKFFDVNYRKNSNQSKVLAKKNEVVKILASKGLSPLSEQELDKFTNAYKKGHKHRMTFGETFTLLSYIVSMFLFLLNYNSDALVPMVMMLFFIGLPALLIYGLVIVPKKKK